MPPSPEWTDADAIPYIFTASDARRQPGPRLPGARLSKLLTRKQEIFLHHWESGLYQISFRLLKFMKALRMQVKERHPGYRLEAVLAGELHCVQANGERTRIRQGQYLLTDASRYILEFDKHSHCHYFVAYYPAELLREFGLAAPLTATTPLPIPAAMNQLLHQALLNPYRAPVQDFYYQNLVRDLLFTHLTHTPVPLPAALTDAEIAAVNQADAILSADLSTHYSIQQLSGMTGTNAFTLKKGFRLLFHMGVFGRLQERRMEQAKQLLQHTSMPIKEVAYEAGYSTVAGFITGFRKRFGKTPLQWREEQRVPPVEGEEGT